MFRYRSGLKVICLILASIMDLNTNLWWYKWSLIIFIVYEEYIYMTVLDFL